MKDKIYIVTITEGSAYDWSTYNKFASIDKDYVYKWTEKFNRIIHDNRERIAIFIKSGAFLNSDKEYCFYEWVHYSEPSARVEEVELR